MHYLTAFLRTIWMIITSATENPFVIMFIIHITVTSQWAQRCLKSRASPWFAQLLVQAQIEEHIKAQLHWPLWGEFTGDRWIPPQKASNEENVSIWWHHNDNYSYSSGHDCVCTWLSTICKRRYAITTDLCINWVGITEIFDIICTLQITA